MFWASRAVLYLSEMIRRLLVILAAVNIVIFAVCEVIYIQAEHSSPGNGFNGLSFIPLYVSVGISILVVALSLFVVAFRRATTVRPSPAITKPYRELTIAIAAGLIPVPLLFFAYNANDRLILQIIGWGMVAGALYMVIAALLRLPRRS